MKPKNSGSGRRIVCLVLVAVMLLGLISSALIIMVNAASSSEIKKELNGLRSQQAELKKEREALQAKIKENQSKTQTLVEKKSDIDQQISMTQASIDNLNEQVQQYSLLIANKQADLEASQAEEQRLNTQYKTRIRSMEETGSISYWAILFGANSFSDLLDKIDVIQEIAKADQLMMDKMKAVSEQIAAERAELEQQMAELDATRQELDQQEQDLEAQRAEQDTLLTEMLAAYEEMNADYMQNMADEAALSEEIAKSESAYYAALSKEEAERIAALNRQNNNKGSSSNSSGATNTGGWLYPLPYQCQVTDSYGYRIHPLTKKYSWHNGVDFGAAAGTAILAAKSTRSRPQPILAPGAITSSSTTATAIPPSTPTSRPCPCRSAITSRRVRPSAMSAPPATPPARTCTSPSTTTAPTSTPSTTSADQIQNPLPQPAPRLWESFYLLQSPGASAPRRKSQPQDVLPQIFKRSCPQIWCPVSGGAYQDARRVSIEWNDIQNIGPHLNADAAGTKP